MSHAFNKPRKRFGQHFLHDQYVIARILQAIAPQPDDQVIEIGPGRGALTLPLREQLRQLAIIEIDRDLVQWWQSQQLPNLIIHSLDALKVDYCALQTEPQRKLRIVGNLPYNISTPILFHLFEHLHCIQDMHFMLQKEVVDRMCAGAGDPDYGRLSVMVQYYCEVTQLFDVGAGAFTPPPKVESSIVRLRPHAPGKYTVDHSVLQQLVAQAFSQRRKTLRNSLKQWFSAAQIQAIGIDPGIRPEQLDLAAFIQLAQLVEPASAHKAE
jgi:16S rRNA (adenine1518-N6/adenine1519-N6)-dimethyltransferase